MSALNPTARPADFATAPAPSPAPQRPTAPADDGQPRWLPWVMAAIALAVAVGGYFMVRGMSSKTDGPKKAPKISLVAPPPPPPPPPKFEKKPDPPKDQKEVKVDQPVQKQDAPPAPPSADLKMEGAAGNGPSAFSSGTVTSDDLSRLGTNKPGGAPAPERSGMFNPFTNYTNVAKGEVQRFLNRREGLKRSRYVLEVHLWVAASGAIQRFELVGASGDRDTDELIRQSLAALPALSQALPADMPMPIRLSVKTGG